MKKHIIWLLTALIIMTLFCCTSAMAAVIIASGTCGIEGDNLTWTLDNEGTLLIDGTGDMADWKYGNDASWYSERSQIKKVVIGSKVTNIEDCAFNDCVNMTSVTIPDSVISIGDSAFGRCESLTSLTIPSSVMSIGENVFSCCTGLKDITVASGNTAYCSLNGVLFDRNVTVVICYPAGKTDFSYNIPNSVMHIGSSAFSRCRNLTNISIPSSVTSMGEYAFSIMVPLSRPLYEKTS